MKKLEIKVALTIQKPLSEVFEAIVDPIHMSNYFIASSTGRMESGKTVTWKFPEFDIQFPVKIEQVERDKYISFKWTDMEGIDTLVEIYLTIKSGSTHVIITEKSREIDEQGINWLKGNTEGWSNFLACLKAYLEYGINLRKGAFDVSQMPA